MRKCLSVAALVVACSIATIPVAGASAGAAPPQAQATSSADLCKNGGWRNLTNGQGEPFRNQGQCVSYMIHHPVALADLAGSFSGTQSFTFENGCLFVNQVIDAVYQVGSNVGTVTLHLGGCVDIGPNFTFSYVGTFSIGTGVGGLTGTAVGPINNVIIGPQPTDFELTLTVTSGSGAFAATSGTMHASIQWFGGPTVTGTLTVP